MSLYHLQLSRRRPPLRICDRPIAQLLLPQHLQSPRRDLPVCASHRLRSHSSVAPRRLPFKSCPLRFQRHPNRLFRLRTTVLFRAHPLPRPASLSLACICHRCYGEALPSGGFRRLSISNHPRQSPVKPQKPLPWRRPKANRRTSQAGLAESAGKRCQSRAIRHSYLCQLQRDKRSSPRLR